MRNYFLNRPFAYTVVGEFYFFKVINVINGIQVVGEAGPPRIAYRAGFDELTLPLLTLLPYCLCSHRASNIGRVK